MRGSPGSDDSHSPPVLDAASMTRERWMALLFATRFTVLSDRPVPGLCGARGPGADAVTFFVGSLLFTGGGALQVWLSLGGPRRGAVGRRGAVRGHPVLQRHDVRGDAHVAHEPGLRPARLASRRVRLDLLPRVGRDRLRRLDRGTGWLPVRGTHGWWEPAVNLLGCIFFGISAVAGYVVPSTGSMLDLAAANWNTALGAACFFACAVARLRSGRSFKAPRLHAFEATVVRDVKRLTADRSAVREDGGSPGTQGAGNRPSTPSPDSARTGFPGPAPDLGHPSAARPACWWPHAGPAIPRLRDLTRTYTGSDDACRRARARTVAAHGQHPRTPRRARRGGPRALRAPPDAALEAAAGRRRSSRG